MSASTAPISDEAAAPQMECPACRQQVGFHYAGVQVFPAHVAQAAGFASHRFELWTCKHCHTSITVPLCNDI